ncbi:SGNH/GDSL hydrolase family protein [Microbacterium kribbense]|uniref:SGNH/GDSL hydrolase family protein n=1 Tax=Microbacterium kribbense TaxID=433645 RepID=A0ABP7GJ90_9MICO
MNRRAITILAVAALGLTALIGASPAVAAPQPPGTTTTYVAFGDSEAAGTGNLPYADTACLRSQKSYPMLLAATFGPVASYACSGATTADVRGQILAAARAGDLGADTRMVTLTVGVNDIDFGGVGWEQMLIGCNSAPDAATCVQTALGAAVGSLFALTGKIGTTVGAIRQAAPHARILVTGYPLLFGQVTDSCSIGAYQGTPVKLSSAYTTLIDTGLTVLNSMIATGVAGYATASGDPGVSYVDVTATFAGHGLCDTGDRWISGLVSGQANAVRSLHANAPGQQAFARVLAMAAAD